MGTNCKILLLAKSVTLINGVPLHRRLRPMRSIEHMLLFTQQIGGEKTLVISSV